MKSRRIVVIFYRPGRNGIEVVRVLHGAMDLPRELRNKAR